MTIQRQIGMDRARFSGAQNLNGASQRAALQRAVSDRQREQHESMRGREYTVAGHLELGGSGEATYPVWFPVFYTAMPFVYGSGSIAAGSDLDDVLVKGNFPRWNVGVAEWYRKKRGNVNGYVGALLVIVADGPTSMRSVVAWQITGPALRSPTDSPDTERMI